MNLAFVGLGHMGLPMALNLLKGGIPVTGFDLSAGQMDALAAAGGRRAASAADAVAGANVVITMLPASKHVEALYLGEHGILAHAPKGALLIDCSTIAPESARKVAQAASAQGFPMIDAPVSGGTGGAKAGTLTFIVGGEAADLDRARPVLEKMGQNIFHVGPAGAGQTAKVCNNMLTGILMIGTSEALRLGMAHGIGPKVLSEVIAKSTGRNWALESYNPCPGVLESAPATHGYAGGFGVDLMLKDLGLAVESAVGVGACVPLGALARNLYDIHSKAGNGGLDFASVFNLFAPKKDANPAGSCP